MHLQRFFLQLCQDLRHSVFLEKNFSKLLTDCLIMRINLINWSQITFLPMTMTIYD